MIRPTAMARRGNEVDAIIIAVIKDSFEDIQEYLRMMNIKNDCISVYQMLFYVENED